MDIIWKGDTSFKIMLSDDRVVFTDPKKPVLSDMILFSSFSREKQFEFGQKNSGFIISGPGEYEVKRIFVNCQFIDKHQDNLIYEILAEEMNLMFFGKTRALPKVESLDLLLHPDILLFPLGVPNLKPSEVRDFKKELDPKIFILYPSQEIKKDTLREVLDILDVEDIKPVSHFKIKPKILNGPERVVLIS